MGDDAKGGRSALGRVEYVLANIYLSYILAFLILFIEGKLGFAVGRRHFYLSAIGMSAFCLVCVLATVRYSCHYKAAVLNAVVSAEIFIVLLHVNYGRHGFAIAMDVSIGIMVVATVLFFFLSLSKETAHKLRQAVIIFRYLAGIICPIALAVIVLKPYVFKEKAHASGKLDFELYASNYFSEPVYGDEYKLANNIDRIGPFGDKRWWEALNLEQKKDSVTALVECECRYFGIPYKVRVAFLNKTQEELHMDNLLSKGVINIGTKSLEERNNEEVLKLVLHAMRHEYQKCICDLYLNATAEGRALLVLNQAEDWCRDYFGYMEYGDSYDSTSNSIEQDALKYNMKTVDEYLDLIKEYQ